MRRVRFTAIGPMEKFPPVVDLLEKDGWTIEKEDMVKNHQKRARPTGIKRIHYKERAQDIVLGCFKDNKDITLTSNQIKKAIGQDMPFGTISGSLAKLAKQGKIKHEGARHSGKWKLK